VGVSINLFLKKELEFLNLFLKKELEFLTFLKNQKNRVNEIRNNMFSVSPTSILNQKTTWSLQKWTRNFVKCTHIHSGLKQLGLTSVYVE